jgi:hypothetical protein
VGGSGLSGACGSPGVAGGDDAEKSLGARLVKLLDFYGRGFDPRNMGISVARNRGEGEFIMRNNGTGDNRPMRVDLSQLHLAPPPGCGGPQGGGPQGWAGLQQATVAARPLVARPMPYGARPRPASEAGDWVPPRPASEAGDWVPPVEPRSPQLSPAGVGHPQRALSVHQHAPTVHGFDWPLHRPMRAAPSNLARYSAFRQRMVGGGSSSTNGEWPGAVVDAAAKFWFDPLYVEDPLRPTNNVGRNCFRIYAIQQEFCKAHALCTMHPGDYAEDCEYPILQRLCKMLR